MSDATNKQPDPRGKGREITPLVIKDLELRSKLGAEKYGETLRAFNGRNALVDAYQEALDLAQYLRQRLEEGDQSEDPDTNYMTRVNEAQRAENARMREQLEQRLITEGATTREKLDAERVEIAEKLGETVTFFGPQGQCVGPVEVVERTISFFGYGEIDVPKKDETILEEAQRLVHGDRGESYGHPIFDMTRTADMVTALLRDKLRVGVRLEAEDIGQMMVAVKMSRHRHSPKRDNLTDTAGYAETLSMIKQWREANPGVDPRDRYAD